MRQLVTVQTIKSLDKILDKDRILYASFENTGWKVIVSSSMKVGDKVVFVEADSVLPINPVFEFLRPRCFSAPWNGFVIKNMKMAGLYSTGIVFPLDLVKSFPSENTKKRLDPNKLKDGDDLTDYFQIKKYDPESLLQYTQPKKKRGFFAELFWSTIYRSKYLTIVMNFLVRIIRPKDKYVWPQFMSKTDETRAQTLNYIYGSYKGKRFYSTEKVDGSSATYGIHKKKFYVCSRNLRLKYDPNNKKSYWWNYAEQHEVEKKLREACKYIGSDFYIQGELLGPSIQGNKYVLAELDFYVFNIRNLETKEYLSLEEMIKFCSNYGFNYVPLLEEFDFNFETIEDLLKYSKGFSKLNPKTIREGVVIRPVIPTNPDRGQSNMCSFKVINPDFDIKHNS